MRELLFRGKAIENYGKYKKGDWIYGNFVEGMNKNDCCINPKRTANHIQVDFETVGQYTGLKDRGEYKIFEGDILQDPDDAALLKVEWSENEASFYAYEIDGCQCYGANEMVCFNVVGNKWDDPELLREMDKGE